MFLLTVPFLRSLMGIVFPLYKDLGIPVQYISIGEDIMDIEPFDPENYLDGLFGKEIDD